MGRVDEALKLWENSVSGPSTSADQSSSASMTSKAATLLGDYAAERERSSETPPTVTERPAASEANAPAHSVATRKSKSRRDRDLDARLVSSGLNAVSLEQYRRLAAVLHEAQAEGGLKTVMLTSAVPHEGKTLTTINLALTLTESYARRVLVIDADLRWPSIHTVLGIANHRGLTEALAHPHNQLPVHAVSERFSVLTAGRPGPAPLAGLSSAAMKVLIEESSRQFDWVLIDTPPVGLLPDAQLLARLAGAVILVIGAGSTPASTIERAVAEIGPECIIGTVLNRVEPRDIADGDYYADYYGQRTE